MVPPPSTKWGFMYRPNNVPYYQRLYQRDDGVRQWFKTSRSKIYLYPYFAILGVGVGGSLWMTGRVIMGHKSWWGEG